MKQCNLDQLEDTNHNHLGKVITYAAGKGAEVVIWVVAHARDEHRQAIENIVDLVTEPGARLENEVPMYLGTEISKILNANEVFGALSQGYSRWRGILDQSHISSGPAMTDVLSKLIEMGLVQRRAPINDAQNKRKAGYFIVDSLSLFYYRYIFRYSPPRGSCLTQTSSLTAMLGRTLKRTASRMCSRRFAVSIWCGRTVRERLPAPRATMLS